MDARRCSLMVGLRAVGDDTLLFTLLLLFPYEQLGSTAKWCGEGLGFIFGELGGGYSRLGLLLGLALGEWLPPVPAMPPLTLVLIDVRGTGRGLSESPPWASLLWRFWSGVGAGDPLQMNSVVATRHTPESSHRLCSVSSRITGSSTPPEEDIRRLCS